MRRRVVVKRSLLLAVVTVLTFAIWSGPTTAATGDKSAEQAATTKAKPGTQAKGKQGKGKARKKRRAAGCKAKPTKKARAKARARARARAKARAKARGSAKKPSAKRRGRKRAFKCKPRVGKKTPPRKPTVPPPANPSPEGSPPTAPAPPSPPPAPSLANGYYEYKPAKPARTPSVAVTISNGGRNATIGAKLSDPCVQILDFGDVALAHDGSAWSGSGSTDLFGTGPVGWKLTIQPSLAFELALTWNLNTPECAAGSTTVRGTLSRP
jgi:hypothetical protein